MQLGVLRSILTRCTLTQQGIDKKESRSVGSFEQNLAHNSALGEVSWAVDAGQFTLDMASPWVRQMLIE